MYTRETGGKEREVRESEHPYKCAFAFCGDGVGRTRRAHRMARGEFPIEGLDKRLKRYIKHEDGAVEFWSDGKHRKIYPDGRLYVRIGEKWVNRGKLYEE